MGVIVKLFTMNGELVHERLLAELDYAPDVVVWEESVFLSPDLKRPDPTWAWPHIPSVERQVAYIEATSYVLLKPLH